jgi:subtilisin family serine protease
MVETLKRDPGRMAQSLERLPQVGSEQVVRGFEGRPALTRLFQSSFRGSVVRLEQSLDERGKTDEVAMIADEILVGLQPGVVPVDLNPLLARLGAKIQRVGYGGKWVIVVLPTLEPDAYYAALSEIASIESKVRYAEPNFFIPEAVSFQLMAPTPANDASYADGSQWSLNSATDVDIDAPEGWTIQRFAPDIVVAVLDSGIDLDHPDLDDNLWSNVLGEPGYDFVNDDNDPDDDNDHGTHVAGIIGAEGNNGIGVSGVCWEVRLMAVKVADQSGSSSIDAVADGLDYARLNGAHVINLSLGGGGDVQTVRTAMEEARDAGIVVVAAAGNDFEELDTYAAGWPARYAEDFENVIVVGSSNRNDELSLFVYLFPPLPPILDWGSNYSDTLVHLFAPGSGLQGDASDAIFSTVIGGYGTNAGTSMAAPHVSGIAALMLQRFQGIPPVEVRDRILASVDPVTALTGWCVTGGRANLHLSLSLFSDLPRTANGWREVPTLGGWVADEHAPWYNHDRLGWFSTYEASRDNLWFYLDHWGEWTWTSEANFPFVYRDGPNPAWCYFAFTPSLVIYYDFSTEQWEIF